jgi:hypothetical protein
MAQRFEYQMSHAASRSTAAAFATRAGLLAFRDIREVHTRRCFRSVHLHYSALSLWEHSTTTPVGVRDCPNFPSAWAGSARSSSLSPGSRGQANPLWPAIDPLRTYEESESGHYMRAVRTAWLEPA